MKFYHSHLKPALTPSAPLQNCYKWHSGGGNCGVTDAPWLPSDGDSRRMKDGGIATAGRCWLPGSFLPHNHAHVYSYHVWRFREQIAARLPDCHLRSVPFCPWWSRWRIVQPNSNALVVSLIRPFPFSMKTTTTKKTPLLHSLRHWDTVLDLAPCHHDRLPYKPCFSAITHPPQLKWILHRQGTAFWKGSFIIFA